LPLAAAPEAITGASKESRPPVRVTAVETIRSGCAGISVVVPSAFSKVSGKLAELDCSVEGLALEPASSVDEPPQAVNASAAAATSAEP